MKRFLTVKFGYQSLRHDYLIVKFFVQRQYRDVENLSKVAPQCPKSPRLTENMAVLEVVQPAGDRVQQMDFSIIASPKIVVVTFRKKP